MGNNVSSSIVALIPARSGSKGVPNKNINLLNGEPVLTYSIMAALKSKLIDRVIVSTDSKEYATIAKNYGAEVPFLRPEEYAQDDSTDLDVIKHFYSVEGAQDLALVRPTTPLRDPAIMNNFINESQE